MSKFVKALLITLAANIGAAAILCAPILVSKEDPTGWILLAFVIVGLALVIQFIMGIVFVAGNDRKETGKGMLLAVGIILLIGLSICGGGLIR